MKSLKVGDKVPQFSLPDENGQVIDSDDLLYQGPLVLYFYPKDDTPGCTVEACSFRDEYEVFGKYGARVVGVSADGSESHLKFKQKYRLPFTLLSDKNRKLQRLFGVKKNFLGLIDGRATYVIDRKGVIRHTFAAQLQPKKHIKEALEVIKRIK